MMNRFQSKLRWGGSILAVFALLAPSCGGAADTGTDSSTHWMRECSSDDQCGALECRCGVCSKECSSDTECGGLGEATCVEQSECARICVPGASPGGAGTGGSSSMVSSGGATPGGATPGGASGAPGGSSSGGASGGSPSGGAGAAPAGDAGSYSAGSGGEGGASEPACAAMDAKSNGDECATILGYAWDGRTCKTVVCGCAGSECEALYASADACDRAHAACYSAAGFERSCTTHADCALFTRDCCAPCGVLPSKAVLGVRGDAPQPNGPALCTEPTPCPACVSTLDLALYPACVEHQCSVLDLGGDAACQGDDDCRVASKNARCACGPHGHQDVVAAGRSYPESECDCTVSYPEDMVARCQNNACVLVVLD